MTGNKVYILRTRRPDGAFGIMFDFEGKPFAVTLEKTFEDGSTILRPGVYDCHKDKYIKGGYDTFEIEVEGYSRVLFHKANIEEDLEGCIAIGEKFEDFGIEAKPGIAESASGFNQFMRKYGHFKKIQLDIKEMDLGKQEMTHEPS